MNQTILDQLLAEYPNLFSKTDKSNNKKMATIFGTFLKEIDTNKLRFKLKNDIERPLQLWREQTEPNNYTLKFEVHIPDIKNIKLIKEVSYNNPTIEALNNVVSNPITNLLPLILSKGSDGTTYGWLPYTGANIEAVASITDGLGNKAYGDFNLQVNTPGSVVNEGVQSEMIPISAGSISASIGVLGSGTNTLYMVIAEYLDGTPINYVASSYLDLSGDWELLNLTKTITTGNEISIFILTGYSPQACSFQVGGGMLESGTSNHPWIPGGTTIEDDSVSVTTAKNQPDNYVYGGMFEDNVITANPIMWNEIGSLGTTDILFLDHQFQANINTCISQLEANIPLAVQNGIKFHWCVLPFIAEGGTDYADPADPTYVLWFLENMEYILKTFPDIHGVSLNDFLYPDEFWQTATQAERTQNRLTLVAFVTAVRNLAHKYNKIFSVNLIDLASHDAYVEDLSPVCDIIMPEIYRGMGQAPIGVPLSEQHKWFKSMVEIYKTKAYSTNPKVAIMPSFISYDNYRDTGQYPSEPEYTTEDIIKDANICLDEDVDGYFMCEFGYNPNDIYLPSGRSYNGDTSTRISTLGLNQGEGISIDTNLTSDLLMVKVPVNHSIRAYTNPETYYIIEGTNNWVSIGNYTGDNKPVIKLVTDTIDELTFYFDEKTPDLILSTIVDVENLELGTNIYRDELVTTGIELIPTVKYYLEVDDYHDHTLYKGFPENEEVLGDKYDKDNALDLIGKRFGIPRRQYKNEGLLPVDYINTTPLYCIDKLEWDKIYQERIKELLGYLSTKHLAEIEFYRLYGIWPTINNRYHNLFIMGNGIEGDPNCGSKMVDSDQCLTNVESKLLLSQEWFENEEMWGDQNPCVYDITANLDSVPKNIRMPSQSEVENLLTKTLGISKLVVCTFSTKEAYGEEGIIINDRVEWEVELAEDGVVIGDSYALDIEEGHYEPDGIIINDRVSIKILDNFISGSTDSVNGGIDIDNPILVTIDGTQVFGDLNNGLLFNLYCEPYFY